MDICPCNICPCDICPYHEYLSCHWPDFHQTLNLFSKLLPKITLDNLRQLSNGHLSMEHLSLRHLSISGMSQLSLTRFSPNFKGRSLGQSWRYSIYHSEICKKFQQQQILPKKFRQKKIAKKCLPKRNFGKKSFFDKNIFCAKRNFTPKKFCQQKICQQKNFFHWK